jgi:hypothetical protein
MFERIVDALFDKLTIGAEVVCVFLKLFVMDGEYFDFVIQLLDLLFKVPD